MLKLNWTYLNEPDLIVLFLKLGSGVWEHHDWKYFKLLETMFTIPYLKLILVNSRWILLGRNTILIFFKAYSRAEWASCIQIYIKIYANNLLHPNITKCSSRWLRILLSVCFIELVNVWNKMLKQGLVFKIFFIYLRNVFQSHVSAMQSRLPRPLFNIHPYLICFYGNTLHCFVHLKLVEFMMWNIETR